MGLSMNMHKKQLGRLNGVGLSLLPGRPGRARFSARNNQPHRYMMVHSSGYEDLSPASNGLAKIKVIGLGGGGSNAVERMIRSGLQVNCPYRLPIYPLISYFSVETNPHTTMAFRRHYLVMPLIMICRVSSSGHAIPTAGHWLNTHP